MENCKPNRAWLANDEEWNAIHDAQESYRSTRLKGCRSLSDDP
jgi:hypothetical protein